MANAVDFLSAHNMFFGQTPFDGLVKLYVHEMDEGLAGRPSSLYMLPSFLRADLRPRREESVLVLDAGGTNLRAARMRFDKNGAPVTEALAKRRMPGADGQELEAAALFDGMAELAAAVCGDSRRACISFSYVFDALPGGDGRILRLCKELQVRGAEGSLICAPLERALTARGAAGSRRWRVVNDSVGSLLGGMAAAEALGPWDDYIGFILGTGANSCCRLPAAAVLKSPDTRALGGETIVNLESGCFRPPLLGDADQALDASSDFPGDHLAEKMTAGGYYPELLRQTLLLAAAEGLLCPASGARLSALVLGSRDVDAFCLAPTGGGVLSRTLESDAERLFAAEVNDALLERAARLLAAGLCAILEKRRLPPGSRVCLCADGTTLRKNPVLRPKLEACLRRWAGEGRGVETVFHFAEDATLLGCAWAGLLDEKELPYG